MACRTSVASVVICGVVAAMAACGCRSGDEKPPAAPAHEKPEDKILLIGKTWQETAVTEGLVNDALIAFVRTTERFVLHLQPKSRTATITVDREELMRLRDGREYHCQTTGTIQAVVEYSEHVDEAAVLVRYPAATLNRKCKESGFPRATERYEGMEARYALRGDQLVAFEPITLKRALLPLE